MNTGIFFSLEKLHGLLLFCMVNYNIRRNEFNGSENREKLGGHLKWTDYSTLYI